MVTVVDPGGAPVPIFNKSGTAVVDVIPGSSGSPGAIPYFAGTTIARIGFGSGTSNSCAALPANVEVGDLIEVYSIPLSGSGSAQGGTFFTTPGDTFVDNGANSLVAGTTAIVFRKITSTEWAVIRSA